VSESKNVFIFGYSGHSYVIIESLMDLGYNIIGYFDYQEANNNPYKLSYFGYELDNVINVKSIVKSSFVFPTVGDNKIREKLVNLFTKLKLSQFMIIDPSANVSRTAQIGLSTYIGKNAIVNAQSIVENGVIINSQSILEHECIVRNFSHIAPNAVLCGNVKIGENTFIGANSVIKQNISITSNVLIGAGSVVVKDIEESNVYFGNPIKKYN
jgi:sugar O-acyltransferase (sialic acid O-acetyltransferase NeuD family)